MSAGATAIHIEEGLSRDELDELLSNHYDDLDAGNELVADPVCLRFVQRILEVHPALESLSASEINDSPWAGSPEVEGQFVHFSITWSKHPTITSWVLTEALSAGLAAHYEESDLYLLPEALAPSLGRTAESPWIPCPLPATEILIRQVIAELPGREDPFLVVASSDHHYIQTYWTPEGFILEHRQGGADQHFRAMGPVSAEAVCAAMAGFSPEESNWQAGLHFEKVAL